MLKKIFGFLIIIIFALEFSFYSQNIEGKDKTIDERADKVIKLAQNAVYKSRKKSDIKSMFIKKSITKLTKTTSKIEGFDDLVRTSDNIIENELSVEFPNKIRNSTFIYKPNTNQTENFTKTEIVSDGEKHNVKTELVRGGKLVDIEGLVSKLPAFLPDELKKQTTKTIQGVAKSNKVNLNDLWVDVFPILLDTPWGSSTFIYAGKAKSSEITADIIELQTDLKREIRLYFAEDSHLLIMITIVSGDDLEKRTDTYYFSNYENIGGVLIATKVNFEGNTISNKKVETSGLPTILTTTKQVTSETVVNEFKANPNFKPDIFAVKEN